MGFCSADLSSYQDRGKWFVVKLFLRYFCILKHVFDEGYFRLSLLIYACHFLQIIIISTTVHYYIVFTAERSRMFLKDFQNWIIKISCLYSMYCAILHNIVCWNDELSLSYKIVFPFYLFLSKWSMWFLSLSIQGRGC